MARSRPSPKQSSIVLEKIPSGIRGLDDITGGGLPRGRPILVCGGAGCGKTVLAMEFLARGATDYNEAGLFVAFEETPDELIQNMASLNFQLDALIKARRLALDYVHVDRSETRETGEYDLEGLFIRLSYVIDQIAARRVVLDTIEALFDSFTNQALLRSELRRLFRWLKEKGVTAIITAERGSDMLTRYGLEEYVADCVLVLDQRIINQLSTRRLRVLKYRGSRHGTNEYPFLIDNHGILVLPITAVSLEYDVANEHVSSGVAQLDEMLGGHGFYRGSSILLSGTAGTGKTSLAIAFAAASCGRGERCLFFAFEESASQITRNMRSIGIDIEPWLRRDLLRIYPSRPTNYSLEQDLVTLFHEISAFKPHAVVLDPATSLTAVGGFGEVTTILTRLLDFCKAHQITTLLTSLTMADGNPEQTPVGISSLMDNWLLLRNLEFNGERNRGLYVLKARGIGHSNQVRELVLSSTGISLEEIYTGTGDVLAGSARLAQEGRERAALLLREQEAKRRRREIERKRQLINLQIAALQSELASEEEQLQEFLDEEQSQSLVVSASRDAIRQKRLTGTGNSESNGDAKSPTGSHP